MKKRLLIGFLVVIMAFFMAIPALATPREAEIFEPKYQEAEVFAIEETRIYWRTTSTGQLQFRVWSMTFGRWNTYWINFG